MKKQFIFLIGIGILNFFLFVGVFKLLQNEEVYLNTLGPVSENYERTGSWSDYQIIRTKKPFLPIENENFERWDAAIYKCISKRMYTPEHACFGNVRAAFFPLFPVLWKVTNSSAIGISMINYFLFIASIAGLILFILRASLPDKMIFFSLLITLPSVIIFYIPYTEALFLFTFALAAIGLMKRKYWIFFAGCFLMATVRPATIFVLFAIALTEILILFIKKDYRSFTKEMILKSAPFISGYFCAIFIQYLYSGTWSAMINAQKNWAGGFQSIVGISDWSVEGFGLSSFSIFFVCLPVVVYPIYLLVQWKKKPTKDTVLRIPNYNIQYLLSVSVFYLIGIFIFTLLTSGGNLHSFFRFTLTSPMFYIVVLVFLNYLFKNSVRTPLLVYGLISVLLFLFLNSVEYGPDRINFSFLGLYIFIFTGLFLIVNKILSQPVKITIALVLVLSSTVWNAYLLNAFFSNGWIFT